MRVRRPEGEQFEIQLVPMIDCMFILLVFFMVATTLKTLDQAHPDKKAKKPIKKALELPIMLPVAAGAVGVPKNEPMLILAVDKYGQKYIGDQPVTLTVFREKVREAARLNPLQRVRLDADRDTKYQEVVEILDLCNFEGLEHVGLHTRK